MYKKSLFFICFFSLFSVQNAISSVAINKDENKVVNKAESKTTTKEDKSPDKLLNAATGVITKIDVDNFKVMIKHAGIKNPDIPAATTAFWVIDNDVLEKVKVGEKISFVVSRVNSSFVVKNITRDGKLLDSESSKK